MKKPLLVTGIHRSGTTWVGKALAKAPGVGYIEEPFRRNQRRGIKVDSEKRWCPCFQSGVSYPFEDELNARLQFKYNLPAARKSIPTKKVLARVLADVGYYARHRITRSRPLVKDPTLFFSAPWFAQEFDAQVVVLIRHPAAFAESLSRTGSNWRFDFNRFLAQPELLAGFPSEWHQQIEYHVNNTTTVLEEASLLWKLFYHAAMQYRENYPDWLFLRHEDLSIQPVENFRIAFDALGLKFTGRCRRFLDKSTAGNNPVDAPGHSTNYQKRNSRANAYKWKKRLSSDQVELIRNEVEPVSSHFYSKEEW